MARERAGTNHDGRQLWRSGSHVICRVGQILGGDQPADHLIRPFALFVIVKDQRRNVALCEVHYAPGIQALEPESAA